jgi:putative transposase
LPLFSKKSCCKIPSSTKGNDRKDNQVISVARQCTLLEVSRNGLYYQSVPESAENLSILRLLGKHYLKTLFYRVERMLVLLLAAGYQINRKRLRMPMKIQG